MFAATADKKIINKKKEQKNVSSNKFSSTKRKLIFIHLLPPRSFLAINAQKLLPAWGPML
jgi:hypothetical protein